MFVREKCYNPLSLGFFFKQRLKINRCLFVWLVLFLFLVIQEIGYFGVNVKILREVRIGKSSVPETLLLIIPSNLSEGKCPYY